MSFNYNKGGEIIEITIRENSGAKIENYKFQVSDTNRAKSIFHTIMKKYGLSSVKKKSDIDWMR